MATSYSYGSSGAKVKKIQDYLAKAGYDGGNDGIYGSNTQAAVKQLQTDYGLEGTGVFDQKTLDTLYGAIDGSLKKTNTGATGSAGSTGTSGSVQQEPYKYDPRYGVTEDTAAKLEQLAGGYTPSDAVKDAQENYNKVNAQKPGAYENKYDSVIQDLYQQITNRKPFSYDINGDALYDIYKEQYTQGGKQAMMDTMGQAAALTGGYGNSYASAAGNQAYQQYMTQLANKVPELEAQAYERYAAEGEDLYNRYGLAQDAEQQAYDRYSDEYNRWLTDHNTAFELMKDAEETDYNRYNDQLNYWTNQADRESSNYWTQTGYEQDAMNSNRDNAYNVAMGLLSAGVLPSGELLKAAGIPEQDARALMSSYAAAAAAGSGSSGRGGGGGSSKTEELKSPTMNMYSEVLELYNAGGMDKAAPYLANLEAHGYDANMAYEYAQNYGNYVYRNSAMDKLAYADTSTFKEQAEQMKKNIRK